MLVNPQMASEWYNHVIRTDALEHWDLLELLDTDGCPDRKDLVVWMDVAD